MCGHVGHSSPGPLTIHPGRVPTPGQDEQLASEVQEIAVKTTVELLHAEPFQDQS